MTIGTDSQRPRLPRVFWILWGGTLVNRLGGAVFPFLAVYLTRNRGFTAELAASVVGLYALGGMLAGPIGGNLADRVGRRATLLLGTTVASMTMLALGFAERPGAIVALAPLLGFFTDLSRPAVQAAVADLVPASERMRAYGLLYWAHNLGFAGAAVLAGAIAERSFTLLFVLDAGTTLIFGALVWAAVPETRPEVVPTARAGSAARRLAVDLLVPFRDGLFMTFVVIQLPTLMIFQQLMVALPLDMRAHGLSTSEVGRLFALNGVVIVLLQPFLTRALLRLSRPQVLVLGTALIGIGFGAVAYAGTVSLYAMTIVVWTLGEIALFTATPGLIAELSPPGRRGAYQGTYQLTWGLAGATAPALGAMVMGTFGARTLWMACLAIGLTSAAAHGVVTGRRLRHHPGDAQRR
jgi:MFS family permease